jgi:hypothetical protein
MYKKLWRVKIQFVREGVTIDLEGLFSSTKNIVFRMEIESRQRETRCDFFPRTVVLYLVEDS